MEEKVIEAMKVISDYCMKNDCEMCKFNDATGCELAEDFKAPCDWEI